MSATTPLTPADDTRITAAAASFVETVTYDDIPDAALHVAHRCILDAFGLYVAGSDQHSIRILMDEAEDLGGRPDAALLGRKGVRIPAPMAARVLGTAGHAHDWDDTQVSTDPAHVYGLLTHPTMSPLTAAIVMAQKLGDISGRDFLLAFLTGFEVECKISEWMLPDHYGRGMHSSGTVGTFGSYATTAKMLGLSGENLRHGFGIAASFAAGIRCNFGTMTKPLHMGRAAENGITAALLAARGYTADPDSLDGIWGFMAVQGGGVSADKIAQGFGNIWSILEPGVSIKPYPCGILTHPSMDLMLKLVTDANIDANAIETVTLFAANNILNPIRYPLAVNHLQAKFSLPAELAMIALARKAGKVEFSDEFVASDAMQAMQRRIVTKHAPEIEAMGFDKVRSRICITLKGGHTVEGWADERYRGGPDNPMADHEVEAKARACCDGIFDMARTDQLVQAAWGVARMSDAARLMDVLGGQAPQDYSSTP